MKNYPVIFWILLFSAIVQWRQILELLKAVGGGLSETLGKKVIAGILIALAAALLFSSIWPAD